MKTFQLIYPILLIIIIVSCTQEIKPTTKDSDEKISTETTSNESKKKIDRILFKTNIVNEIGKEILCIYQDRNNNYWFGTNAGVFWYDGKTMVSFTVKDGLSQNQILAIQEYENGIIYFSTGGFSTNSFDGKTIREINVKSTSSNAKWISKPSDLWMRAGDGVFRFDGQHLNYLPFPKNTTPSNDLQTGSKKLSPYSVYCTLKDRQGNLWFGTQSMGVCKFDGTNFKWYNEKGLSGPAVLTIFEDKKGTIWFGNNGNGLFSYDGSVLRNITEDLGLSNYTFQKTGKSGPGTLARVWSLNEDKSGNLWIGTGDAGIWKYDGTSMTNFTSKNGYPNLGTESIYLDKNQELLFGTAGDGIYQMKKEGEFIKKDLKLNQSSKK